MKKQLIDFQDMEVAIEGSLWAAISVNWTRFARLKQKLIKSSFRCTLKATNFCAGEIVMIELRIAVEVLQ